MPLNYLGKILFPAQADWERKKQMKIMLWVVLVAVLLAAIMGALILFKNPRFN
jgi:hypothetical protein